LAAQQQAAASSKNAEVAAERDQLKEKIAKIEKELNSAKTELDGANDRTNKLRERLRQFQKMIHDLRATEKELESRLAEAEARSGQQQPTTEVVADGPTASQSENETAKPTQALKPKVAEDAEGKPDTPTEAPTPAKELLRPPPGGFSFGPSEAAAKAQPKELPATAEAKSQSSGSLASKASTPSQPTGSASAPLAAQKPDDEGRKVPSTTTANAGDSTALSPKTTTQALLPPRRGSGNKAELSMKEKLLEKKRRMAEKMTKVLQLQAEARQAGESAEPAQKRPKLESEKDTATVSDEATVATSPFPPAHAPSLSQKDQVMTSESKGGEDEEGEEGEVAEAVVETTPPSSAPSSTGAAVAGGIPFGRPSHLGAVNPFAGAPAPFGSGSAPVFGSAASISGGTTFGSKAASASSPGGGAFLEMTPPGTQATPPTFQFGNSGNITLPTPSTRQTSANSPFGVFSGSGTGGPNPFGAFGGASPVGGAKPLFGSAAPSEEPKQEEAEKVAEAEHSSV
jgi:hypothetical protein